MHSLLAARTAGRLQHLPALSLDAPEQYAKVPLVKEAESLLPKQREKTKKCQQHYVNRKANVLKNDGCICNSVSTQFVLLNTVLFCFNQNQDKYKEMSSFLINRIVLLE